MAEYIIYTTEGCTIAPNEDVEVENCQVLGRAYGNNSEEAKDNLLKDNPWITEAGFDKTEFIVEQLMTDVWNLPAIGRWEKSCGKHARRRLFYHQIILM